jgi:hypothetical protein
MNLQARVDEHPASLGRITAVARRSEPWMRCDLLWPPVPRRGFEILMDDPGVLFESSGREVMFQWIEDELRYRAGARALREGSDALYLEQDRIWAEGEEMGVFGAVTDALTFTEQYLVEWCDFAEVDVPRQPYVSHCHQSTFRLAKRLRPFRDRAWMLRRWLAGRMFCWRRSALAYVKAALQTTAARRGRRS